MSRRCGLPKETSMGKNAVQIPGSAGFKTKHQGTRARGGLGGRAEKTPGGRCVEPG